MALAKGTNSYVTVAEADTYFEDRLDVAAWTSANATQKAQALVTATSVLDSENWVGIAISDSQPLAFPRVGTYFDPRLGYITDLPVTVPVKIEDATCELAYHLLNNDGLLDDTGSVSDLQVGTISLHIKNSAGLVPPFVKKMIRPLLENGGSRMWWRAN